MRRRLLTLAAAGGALWYVRTVHRFRDPVRLPAPQPGEVLSPADGVVCFVRRVSGGEVAHERLAAPLPTKELLGHAAQGGWLLGVYVGPLDVHYAYQPVAGEIASVEHSGSRVNVPLLGLPAHAALLAGRPADLLESRGTLENERLNVVTRTPQGEVTVALVSPGTALKVTSYLRAGDAGRAGYKAAFLPEGGLVLLHLPPALTPQVSVGDRVVGAETVVARG